MAAASAPPRLENVFAAAATEAWYAALLVRRVFCRGDGVLSSSVRVLVKDRLFIALAKEFPDAQEAPPLTNDPDRARIVWFVAEV